MEVSTILVCVMFKSRYDILTMGMTKYYWVVFYFSLLNFYVAMDTYLIIHYRGTMYYETDHIYCYFAYWCDWFSYFWIDILKMLNSDQKKNE